MDSTEVGRFGTLRLVKRLDPQTIVASFPIDDESVTFGRDPNCSVRLYYPTVSAFHAKIFFQERKAFLVVLGANGLFVDGCQVFPAQTESSPTTIPLPNNSEIEIHKKRFVFTYPPKDLRSPAINIDTPARTTTNNSGNPARKRTLRLSMIQSAEVFSPRPSTDPSVNLKVLQSPLKPRSVSPVKPSSVSRLREAKEKEQNDEEIVLVDGNHPRVVEDDRDLVILEDIPYTPPPPQVTPPSSKSHPLISAFPLTPNASRPQTPRRGSSRPSLHKAVLIRSAQRAIMQSEQRTDNIIMAADDGDTTEEEEEVKKATMNVSTSGEDSESGEEYDSSSGEEEEEEEEGEQDQKPVSRWRKSLEMIGGLFRSSVTPEQEDAGGRAEGRDDEEKENEDAQEAIYSTDEDENMILNKNRHGSEDNDDMEITDADVMVNKYAAPTPSTPRQVPYRTLGKFMTPQVAAPVLGRGRAEGGRFSMGTPLAASAGRYDEGYEGWGGARRVRRENAWKVRDIVIPVKEQNDEEEQGEEEEPTNKVELQLKERDGGMEISSPTKAARAKLSEEERKAIQDRRRSALKTPDTFFGGQAPGTFGPHRTSLAYAYAVATPARSTTAVMSPVKKVDSVVPAEDEDTKALLERMKETVEGMKRRRSGVPPTPIGRTSLAFAKAQADMESTQRMEDGEEEPEEGDEDGSDKENHNDVIEGPTEDASSEQDELALEIPTQDLVQPTGTSIPKTPQLHLKHIFSAPSAPPKTPSFKGVREMFQDRQQVEPQTPKMDGIKAMFRQPKVPETPAFEGIGEMMRTPVAYRMSVLEEEDGEEEIDKVVKSRRGRSALATSSKPPSSSKPTTARGKTRRSTATGAVKTPVTEGKSNFADDEATPGEGLGRVEEESEKKAVTRRGRSKLADSSDVEDTNDKPQRKARLIRSSKRVIEDIPEEQTEQAKALSSRSRKVVTQQADEEIPAGKTKEAIRTKVTTSTDEGASSRPVRRIAKPPSTADDTDTRPARKAAARKLKTPEISEADPKPTRIATRKPRAGTRTTDDESAAPAEKTFRTRANTAEEVESTDDLAPAKSRRGVRSRNEPTTDVTEVTKADTGRRVPAKKALTKRIAPGESEDGVNKENTPSMDDEEPTNVKRVTRAKKPARGSAKEESEIEDPPTTKPKTARTTRARK